MIIQILSKGMQKEKKKKQKKKKKIFKFRNLIKGENLQVFRV
jgi:hypothetical protein